MLQEYLAQYKDIYQYVYSHVFSEVYTTSEKRGFDLKSNFHILFKTYRDKQMIRQYQVAKNPANFEEKNETNEFEQKQIKNFDPFTNSEEQKIKERAKRKLAERRDKTEELKIKKPKIKTEENKVKEVEMREKLNELNGQFKKIRESKKDEKKISDTILK